MIEWRERYEKAHAALQIVQRERDNIDRDVREHTETLHARVIMYSAKVAGLETKLAEAMDILTAFGTIDHSEAVGRVATLQAEVARLRAALADIEAGLARSDCGFCRAAVTVARAALGAGGEAGR